MYEKRAPHNSSQGYHNSAINISTILYSVVKVLIHCVFIVDSLKSYIILLYLIELNTQKHRKTYL